jgi:transposase InsO family protein
MRRHFPEDESSAGVVGERWLAGVGPGATLPRPTPTEGFSMPPPLTPLVRERIAALLSQGLTPTAIATQLRICSRSVRRIRSRLRQRPADLALQPDYRAGGRRRSLPRERLRQRCAELRRLHPTWGAGRIRVQMLHERLSGVPERRILSRWLKELGLAQSPTVADKPQSDARSTEPHHTWQMDAKECIRLANGRLVCWLRLVDEFTGAVLLTVVFDFPRWAEVTPQQVQDVLRRAFARWGKPACIRADNGYPWGATGGLPTCLALWLAGLGIELVNIPPRQPQKNGVVERSQGTGARWAEPWQCQDVAQLQKRVDEEDRVQRQEYAESGRPTRLQAFPALLHSGRGYAASLEELLWDLAAALIHLGKWEVRRQIDKKGHVTMSDRKYYVGVAFRGQMGRIRLDAATVEWVVRTEAGEEIARLAARGLSRQEILAYNVCRPKRRRQPPGPTSRPTPVVAAADCPRPAPAAPGRSRPAPPPPVD